MSMRIWLPLLMPGCAFAAQQPTDTQSVLWVLLALLTLCCCYLLLRLRRMAKTMTQPLPSQLPHSLLYDDVTELPNKWLAKQRFQQQLAVPGGEVAFLLVKIEGFSEVDKILGHSHANLVLHQIGRRLGQFLQPHNAVLPIDGQPLAHLNGVDFLVLVDPQGRQHQAGFLAHQLEQQIAEPLLLHGCAVHYQIRCGVACYPNHGADFNEVLANAYLAQQQRPDGSPLYLPSLAAINPDKLTMMAQLQQAIASGQLQLDVQPQILLADKQVVAAEVLLRWQHPQRGLLAPRQFIPLAEEMGLMFPLTCWVLQQAISTLSKLQSQGIQLQLCVNVTSRDLLALELVEQITRLLHQCQVSATQLVLELKEDALMHTPNQVLPVLKRLAELGTPLVLDDFGSGYTSLGMLREMPISGVKIDAQFVQALLRSDAQVAITGAMIDLAKNLQLTVVAEGVEEQATADRLLRMGCSRAQGFLFSQPFALAGLEPWLRQHHISLH